VTPRREAELDELMSRLARGDRAAFDPLYEILRPRALRLAQSRVSSDAGDVAQSALLKVFSRASEFEPGRPCLPWFYAIVANEIHAVRRGTSRFMLDPTAGEDVLANSSDAEAELVAREMARAVELAIASLDEDAANTIGALLGRGPMPAVAPATFRKRISRAYAKLRLLLGGPDVG